MWKNVLPKAGGALQPWQKLACRRSTTASESSTVDSILLRSLKEHYLKLSRRHPPPKKIPPWSFKLVIGALDTRGPVLQRRYGDEEISIRATRSASIISGGGKDDDGDDKQVQLFIHMNISKPGQKDHLQFICRLYPDAFGIHSVLMAPVVLSSGSIKVSSKYNGSLFKDLDQKMRDALGSFIEERGVNENLFPFLDTWLSVKDDRNLMKWFRAVATFINEEKQAKDVFCFTN